LRIAQTSGMLAVLAIFYAGFVRWKIGLRR
jgi:hypothetical protein